MNSFRFIGRGIAAAVRAADRAVRVGRGGRAAHLRLRAEHRHADAAPLEGGGGRLPLLPRARSRAGRARAGAGRAAARRAARAAGGSRSASAAGGARASRTPGRSSPPTAIRRTAGLVAGGVAEREAFNFAMNQPIPAGANLAELAKVAKAAKDLTREALVGRGRRQRRGRVHRGRVPGADRRLRRLASSSRSSTPCSPPTRARSRRTAAARRACSASSSAR